jgi:hypothetical protein
VYRRFVVGRGRGDQGEPRGTTPAVDGSVLAVAGPSDLPRAALCFAKLAREFGRNPPPRLRADPSTAGSRLGEGLGGRGELLGRAWERRRRGAGALLRRRVGSRGRGEGLRGSGAGPARAGVNRAFRRGPRERGREAPEPDRQGPDGREQPRDTTGMARGVGGARLRGGCLRREAAAGLRVAGRVRPPGDGVLLQGVGVGSRGLGVLLQGVGMPSRGPGVLLQGAGMESRGPRVLLRSLGVLLGGLGNSLDGPRVHSRGVGVLLRGLGILLGGPGQIVRAPENSLQQKRVSYGLLSGGLDRSPIRSGPRGKSSGRGRKFVTQPRAGCHSLFVGCGGRAAWCCALPVRPRFVVFER